MKALRSLAFAFRAKSSGASVSFPALAGVLLLLAFHPGALAHGGSGGSGGHSGGGGGWHGGGGGWHGGGGGWHGGGGHDHFGRHFRGAFFDGPIGYPYYGWDAGYGLGYGYGDYYGDPGYDRVPPPAYTGRPVSLVTEVQESLAQAGFYHGIVDGRIGPQTRTAISRYQSIHHLPVSRRIDEPLLESLRLL